MAILLVAYDLNSRGQNYSAVLEYIKGHAWARLSESAYAIETNKTPDTVPDDIRRITDANDNIYVVGLSGQWSGYGPQDINQWLKNRL